MSAAFICAAGDARVSNSAILRRRSLFPDDTDGGPRLVRLSQKTSWMIWLAQLADGRALVQADTQIDIGYEVFLPGPGAASLPDVSKVVASIDRSTRAATKEWLISWEGTPPNATADAPLVHAQLAPEWFAQPLLRWIAETAGAPGTVVDLTGFADGDVPLSSVITLARCLAADGLVTVGASGQTVTATMTTDGVTAAGHAADARTDPRQRSQALRRGMITWLADRENASSMPHDWKSFLLDPRSTFQGDFFTIGELAREAQYLAERGLIRALAARDGTDSGWTLPRLTAKGRDCNDDHGGDVAESLKPGLPGRSTHISVTGSPGTQINAGDHNAQHTLPTPTPATPPPTAEGIGWWRRAWNFLTSVAGIVTMAGTVVIALLTYLLLLKS